MEIPRHYDILIASDDAVQCAGLIDLLSRESTMTPHVGTSLPEVLRILADHPISCIIQGPSLSGLSGFEIRKIIKEITPVMPVILHVRKMTLRKAWRTHHFSKKHFFHISTGDLYRSNLEEVIRHALAVTNAIRADTLFQHRLFHASSADEEKLLVLKTSLDILDKESKDIFVRILSVLSDIPENDYTGILNDYINELYECTAEALGFMRSEKRIEPLVDIVNSLKLGRDKIPLPSESRVELTYGPRKLLFIEISRLIKNALGNIIDNALKFSPEHEKVLLHISQDMENVFISVTDHGSGIPHDKRQLLFQREVRPDKAAQPAHSGQGLWIAANIIKEDRGEITVQDNPGGGTVVTVRFPRFNLRNGSHNLHELCSWFKLPLEVIEKKARIMQTILLLEFPEETAGLDSLVFTNLLDHLRDERRKKERQKYYFKLQEYTRLNPQGTPLLLVDDSLFVHYSIAPVLTEQGYRIVDFAFNGLEALNLYRIFKPALVIMDVSMPVKSGIEAAVDIYHSDSKAGILFVTALKDYEPLRENIRRRFQGMRYAIVCKPIHAADLLAAVNTLVSGKH